MTTTSSLPEEQVAQLQQYEQQLQQIMLQRQTMQVQLLEAEQASESLGKTKEQPFKMVGALLIATSAETLREELHSKKEMLEIRLKNIEQQEGQLRQKFTELHTKLLQSVQKTA